MSPTLDGGPRLPDSAGPSPATAAQCARYAVDFVVFSVNLFILDPDGRKD